MAGLTHKQVQRLVLSGEALTAGQKSQVEAHLAGCPSCREYASLVHFLEQKLPEQAPQPEQRIVRSYPPFIQTQRRDAKMRRTLKTTLFAAGWLLVAALFFYGLQWTI